MLGRTEYPTGAQVCPPSTVATTDPRWENGRVSDHHQPPYGAAPGSGAHASPYPQQDVGTPSYGNGPGPGYTSGYVPLTSSPPAEYGAMSYQPPPRTSTLGLVALGAGAIALIGSIVNAAIAAALFDPASLGDDPAGAVGLVAAVGLLNLMLLWFAFGLWAIVQGIVAIVQKRGVGAGIGGLVLGLIGPWVGVTVAAIAFGVKVAEYSSSI